MVSTTGFVRRVNRDSTTDSICLSCFKPVARAAKDFELVDEENYHTCAPLEPTPGVDAVAGCGKES